MTRWVIGATLALSALAPAAPMAAGPRDALVRARQLYNSQQYDLAIDAAREAGRSPDLADAASLVLARALLERFRRAGGAADLSAARETLKQIRAAELAADDRAELAIALGESLFLGDQAGAAAEQFDLALARDDQLDPVRHERLLDWWAGALDRQARASADADARALYARIVRRMEDELRRDTGSAVASYWIVAGARGTGDIVRAWDAAIAAWVRAPRGEDGGQLRNDLDRLVIQVIIPERARQMSSGDSRTTVADVRADWERFKEAWAIR